MALHIIKLCVGATTIDDLAVWQARLVAFRAQAGLPPRIEHTTFQSPKRQDAVLDGGSLYWVIKGVVQVRQRIVGFDTGQKEDGSACCLILLDHALVPVRPVKRRPFQGWRYLSPEDAPPDLGSAEAAQRIAAMTPQMRKDLVELGLL
jgi:hypothetical protein